MLRPPQSKTYYWSKQLEKSADRNKHLLPELKRTAESISAAEGGSPHVMMTMMKNNVATETEDHLRSDSLKHENDFLGCLESSPAQSIIWCVCEKWIFTLHYICSYFISPVLVI